jgi:tyrosinase
MTDAELVELRAAFAKLQEWDDDRGYQYHSGIHGLPLPMYCSQAHGQPAFLPWHRAYLYRFELALRTTGHDVMLPWWDWVTVREIPTAYESNDGNNPLYSVRINGVALQQGARGEGSGGEPEEKKREQKLSRMPDTTRDTGHSPGRIPTPAEIEALLKYPDFSSFTEVLESYHGGVHMWVGGHMEDIPFAAYDPIFWAHHCMIDRLWRMWQLRHTQASFPANVASEVMEPFNLTAGDVLDPTTLGYDYVTSSTAVKVGD